MITNMMPFKSDQPSMGGDPVAKSSENKNTHV